MKAYLDPEEVQLLEEAAEYARDRLLVRVLFHLGCRISEALAIEVKDVDFRQGTVTIVHLKAQKRLACPGCGTRLGSTHVFCPGCGQRVERAIADEREHRKVRTLPVDQGTLEMMRDYIDRGGPVSSGGKQLLFGITRSHAWKIVKDCAQAAGLEKLVNPETGRAHNVSPHRLRDAFAVMAMKRDDSGDGQRMLQERLGHASFNTTARYRKVSNEDQREWLGRVLGGDEPCQALQ